MIKLVAVVGALHLRKRGRKRICERFGITIQRTVQELNGKAWLELDEETPMARQVMSSLSFGERVESLVQLREAISYHAANSDGLAGVAAVRQSIVQRGNELFVHSPQKSASS
ncbi:hypothetical protein [Nitrosospira sp. Nsp13]|uniref:hypothetical protein n=1 Tax=Nitrosospira sp. Nsp13 TaxID=1855332 RepID=UPI000B867B60|nr:hypothetical protein [Nitrosospira sp. Nsp13]